MGGEVRAVVIAAPASGSGKTTVATGLIGALRRAGHRVAPFKVGPDYIDPGYHGLAAGRPGRNLDPVLVGAERVVPLYRHGARDCDLAVVEGVMGLFDGRIDANHAGPVAEGSTAQVASLLGAPVVLVVDARGHSQSLAALLHGFATFDSGIRLGGVILNRVGSERHDQVLRAACDRVGLPVLGSLPRMAELEVPSRHLGLIPAVEHGTAATEAVSAMTNLVAAHVDLAAIAALARSTATGPMWDAVAEARGLGSAGHGGQIARHDGPVSALGGRVAGLGAQVAGDGQQTAGDRMPAAGDHGPVAGLGRQVAGGGGPVAGLGRQVAGDGGPVAGGGGPVAGLGRQVAGDGGPVAGDGGPVARHDGPMARDGGQAAGHGGQAAGHDGPVTGHDGPVTGHDGPVAGHDGPVTGHDGPVAGHDGPVTGHDGPVARHDGPVTGRDGLVAGHGGPMARDGGQAAGHGGPVAGRGGPVAGHDGPVAGRGGPVAGRGGPVAGHDGPVAGRGGQAAGRGGPVSRHDGQALSDEASLDAVGSVGDRTHGVGGFDGFSPDRADIAPLSAAEHGGVVSSGPLIAMAGGPAFTFGYAEHRELLLAAGAQVVVFDPLRDELPEGTAGLVLPGGFPEEHAAELAANTVLLGAVAARAKSGMPVHAECAGLLYLTRSLDGHPMARVIDADAEFGPRLTLGYRDAVALADSPLWRAGERVRGHEFHRTRLVTAASDAPAWGWHGSDGARVREGALVQRVHASYLHTHPAGNPDATARFVAAAVEYAGIRASR